MQVPAVDAASGIPVPAGAGVPARVLAGSLARLPPGELLAATVASATGRDAILNVNGQALALRLPPGPPLTPGAALLLRVPPSTDAATPSVELFASRQTPSLAPPAQPAPPPRLSVVDVLAQLPDGRVHARVDGAEQVATSAEPLAPGGRYVLQVESTPAGPRLTPPPADAPALPADVATALLRAPAPSLPAALASLRAQVATLASAPPAVRDAAAAVEGTLRDLMPADSAPAAKQLQQFVENGGLHFEAKLARQAEVGPTAAPAQPAAPDLKGDLLRLLQAVNDLGGTVHAPAAEAALGAIEAQQASNVLAQDTGTPYLLQLPFPDGGEWRTLSLSLEPQYRPGGGDSEPTGRFRVFMHVPLADMGETWIDAGVSGDRFRATIYLDRSAVRDRVRSALPDLHEELRAAGFSEVLLDVRPTGDLPEARRREAGAVRAGRPGAVSVLDVRA